ncbi:MAG: hypothetical protein AAF329_25520 [Cyanobacteria bacterium P01_A01_bin.17]
MTLTLPEIGQMSGTVIVSARLAKPGLQDGLEAIRDLILGPTPEERYPIAFEIPQVSRGILNQFFSFV